MFNAIGRVLNTKIVAHFALISLLAIIESIRIFQFKEFRLHDGVMVVLKLIVEKSCKKPKMIDWSDIRNFRCVLLPA